MRRLLLAVAMLASVIFTAPAQADTVPGERPVDQPTQELVALARTFWAARGVTGCQQGIDAYIADSLLMNDGVDAAGRGGNCAVWFKAAWLSEMRDGSRTQSHGEITIISPDPELWCAVVVHEVGHALGLPHSETGVMAANGGVIPFDCYRWAAAKRQARSAASAARTRRSAGHRPARGLRRASRSCSPRRVSHDAAERSTVHLCAQSS